MQAITMNDNSRSWSVVDVFGEDTLRQRPKFGSIHYQIRRRYDRMGLAALKAASRECRDELEREYINQNITIIQLARKVIS